VICIYCGSKTRVSNSRAQKKTNQTWRRRKCLDCNGVFTSSEAVDFSSSLLYQRDANHVEPLSRDKLYISVYKACQHRKNAVSDATALTSTIIGKLMPKVRQASLQRNDIISVTSEVLNRLDKAASVQYTAYHPL